MTHSAMAIKYARAIREGRYPYKIENVPKRYREEVREILEEEHYIEGGE